MLHLHIWIPTHIYVISCDSSKNNSSFSCSNLQMLVSLIPKHLTSYLWKHTHAHSHWQTREIPLHRITKQISLLDNAEICHIYILSNRKIKEAFILKRGSDTLIWFSGQCLLKCSGISCFRVIKCWLLYFCDDFNSFSSDFGIIGFLDFTTIYYDFIRFL